MNSLKDIAYQILKEAKKPLHSRKITEIALKSGFLKTSGKTPEATMNAILIVDVNKNKENSRFVKMGLSTFALNPNLKEATKKLQVATSTRSYNSLATISTIMKGKIAEDWIASLITLYGDKALSCYKPLSDDEGIDLIVKQKGSELNKTIYLQIKSRYNLTKKGRAFVSTVKKVTVSDSYRMAIIFCYFDFDKGEFQDNLWFIPAPDFIDKANKLKGGRLGFVASPKSGKGKKWDKYMIEKKDLANSIISQMERI